MTLEFMIRDYYFNSTGQFADDKEIMRWFTDLRNNSVLIGQDDVEYLISSNSRLMDDAQKDAETINILKEQVENLRDEQYASGVNWRKKLEEFDKQHKAKLQAQEEVQRLKLQVRNQGVIIKDQNEIISFQAKNIKHFGCGGCAIKINSEECYSCMRYYTDKFREVI